jgi:uncharacterized protein (TIGR03066 family)
MLLRVTALLGLLLVPAGVLADDKKDDPKAYEKLIVGKWKLTKTSQGDLPEGLEIVLDVEKGGKFKIIMTNAGEKDVNEGKWKVEGKKFPIEFTEGSRKGMSQTDEIKELTEKKLTLHDANDVTEYWEKVEEKKKDQ